MADSKYKFVPGEKVGWRTWSGKCWHCGADVTRESKEAKLHLIACKNCRRSGDRMIVFSSLEAMRDEEERWGRRAFE